MDEKNVNLTIIDVLRQGYEGCMFLSEKKVLHNDIAARNILVTTDGTFKISDFGLARMQVPVIFF